jgi:hypothetical protein
MDLAYLWMVTKYKFDQKRPNHGKIQNLNILIFYKYVMNLFFALFKQTLPSDNFY